MYELREKSLPFGSIQRPDQLFVSFIYRLLHSKEHDPALLGQECAFCSTIFRVYLTADNPTRLEARQDS